MEEGTIVMAEPKTLNVVEAAEMLQIMPATLYNWLSENRYGIHVPAYKVGGRWLFFQDELVDWIRQHPPGEKSDEDEF